MRCSASSTVARLISAEAPSSPGGPSQMRGELERLQGSARVAVRLAGDEIAHLVGDDERSAPSPRASSASARSTSREDRVGERLEP